MQRQGYWGYIFTFPFVINLLVFFAFPFFFSLYLTFTTWDLFNPPKWVALDNWIEILSHKPFWLSLRNVFFFACIFVPLQTFLALIMAYMLNLSIRGKVFYRIIYFLPVVTPWVAGGLVWLWLYNLNFGLINWTLGIFHVEPVDWLNNDKWWVVIGSIALVNVWKGVGYAMVILLAGMQNISKEIFEAARIDGASAVRLFFKIALPLVSPMIYLVMILTTIAAFHAFDVFLVMMDSKLDGIPDRNNVTNILIYRDAFLYFKMGSASTMSWALFLIILIITLIQKYWEKRWVHYE